MGMSMGRRDPPPSNKVDSRSFFLTDETSNEQERYWDVV